MNQNIFKVIVFSTSSSKASRAQGRVYSWARIGGNLGFSKGWKQIFSLLVNSVVVSGLHPKRQVESTFDPLLDIFVYFFTPCRGAHGAFRTVV